MSRRVLPSAPVFPPNHIAVRANTAHHRWRDTAPSRRVCKLKAPEKRRLAGGLAQDDRRKLVPSAAPEPTAGPARHRKQVISPSIIRATDIQPAAAHRCCPFTGIRSARAGFARGGR